jgi:hypothetical protein
VRRSRRCENIPCRRADYPGLAEFIAENVLTVPSDAEVLAVFTESANRAGEEPQRVE